ncbi:hypothetical protein [Paraburkholderia sp.]|uniref:hypothetical protein n=1 Tax=Paraburkholderia sp. TaxID=1926495 RepID=UPI0023968A27|nr:hypothetical protein [Paraburkholderia sp.]MDE1181461.1 hypothetical protein [Paraburkholderia sp.]
MWKTSLAAVLAVSAATAGAPLVAHAQTRTQVVQWQVQVIQDGQQIDAFDGTTTVGQARTDTHHHVTQHNVGCKDQPAGSIDLSRTLTVSPTQADPDAVTLQIDAQETLEDTDARQTDTGCKSPPQPRKVAASHPGLRVAAGQWATWQIVDKNPSLVYRVHAAIATGPSTP